MHKQKNSFPSKTTMNLAMREEGSIPRKKLIPALLLLAVLICLFGKFAVADRINQVHISEQKSQIVLNQKASLENALKDYDEVKAKYARYSDQDLPEERQGTVSRTVMLDILEQKIMPVSRVNNLAIAGNLMSLELEEISLQTATSVVDQLYTLPAVKNVEVCSVSTGSDNEAPGVSMLITMVNGAAEEEHRDGD